MIPVVSVLLPAFDASATLEPCLRSIARQTLADWECVVVDDGSRDDTRAVADAMARRDARFRVLSIQHRGLVGALQLGLNECRGRYVARMDADDLMHRERLAAQLAALEALPGLAAVGAWVRCFPRAARGLSTGLLQTIHRPLGNDASSPLARDGRRAYERWLNAIDSPQRVRAEAFVECPIAHPTLMIRRDVLAAAGYRDCGWPEDYDLILRLLAAGEEIGVVPRRLLLWRDGPARLSRVAPAYGLDRFTACKAAHLAAGLLARSDSYILCGYGSTGRGLRRALLAHGKRPAAIVDVHPRRIGGRIHGIPVLSCDQLPHYRGLPIVTSVARVAARAELRAVLTGFGFEEGRDFVCAA